MICFKVAFLAVIALFVFAPGGQSSKRSHGSAKFGDVIGYMKTLFHDVKKDQSKLEQKVREKADPIIKKIHETNIMGHLSDYAKGGNPKDLKQKICVNHDEIVRLIDKLPKSKTDLLLKGLNKWKTDSKLVKAAKKILSAVEKVTFSLAELKLRVMLRLLKVVLGKVCDKGRYKRKHRSQKRKKRGH